MLPHTPCLACRDAFSALTKPWPLDCSVTALHIGAMEADARASLIPMLA
jgi:hypothetical protein